MSDIETVLIRCSEFEKILKSKLNAEGDGLGQQARSIENLLSSELVSKLKWISKVRNEAAHDPITFRMPKEYIRTCDQVSIMLKREISTFSSRHSLKGQNRDDSSNKFKGIINFVYNIFKIAILFVIFRAILNGLAPKPAETKFNTILRKAAKTCDYDLTKIALKEGGNPNSIVNDFGNKGTALVEAVDISGRNQGDQRCLRVINLLLDNKADPNAEGPLHLAAQNADLDVIKLLIKRGANPKMAFGDLGIPLSWFLSGHPYNLDSSNNVSTAEKPHYEKVFSVLLSVYTSNINEQDKSGNTLLIKLVNSKSQLGRISSSEVLGRIIKLGADPKHRNQEGKTAYDYAFENNLKPDIIKLLNGYR
jgi:Ankyrin repeats (3 copies)